MPSTSVCSIAVRDFCVALGMLDDDGGIVIRTYRPADDAAVKSLFRTGMRQTNIPGMRRGFAGNPYFYGLVAGAAAAGRVAAGSWLGAAVAGGAALAAFWLYPYRLNASYVAYSLGTDLRDIAAHYLTPGRTYLVAVDTRHGGRVVGTVAVDRVVLGAGAPRHAFSWNDGDAELRRMSVDEALRGRGVGRRLLAAAKAFAREQGYPRLVLSTSAAQATARQLYTKHGFKEVHRSHYLPLNLFPIFFYVCDF